MRTPNLRIRIKWTSPFSVLAGYLSLVLIHWMSVSNLIADVGIPPVSPSEAGYVMKHWGIEDGLPLDRLTSLAQTPDGFLWIGTDEQGLTRFDGTKFVSITPDTEPNLPGWTIMGLTTGSSGRLWIHTQQRVSVMEGDTIRRIDWESGGPVAECSDGTLFVQCWYNLDLSQLAGDRLETVHATGHPTMETRDQTTTAVECDAWGRLWALRGNGRFLYVFTETGANPVELSSDAAVVENGWKCFFRFPDGRLGLLGRAGLYLCDEAGWIRTRSMPMSMRGTTDYRAAAVDSLGNVWMAAHDGSLYLWPPDEPPRQMLVNGAPFEAIVRELFMDDNHAVWLATHSGLYRFRTALFESIPPQDDWENPRVFDASPARDGALWFSADARIFRVEPGSMSFSTSVRSKIYRAMTAGDTNELYGASLRDVFHTTVDPASGSATERVLWTAPAVVEVLHWSDRSGLWVGTETGIHHLAHGATVARRATAEDQVLHIVDFAEYEDGRLLALTKAGELRLGDGQTWSRTATDLARMGNGAVGLTIAPRGEVWIAHRTGVLDCFHDGRWRRFTTEDVPLPQSAMGIVSDQAGGLWWNTLSEGVVHLDADSAQALADGTASRALTVRFGLQDGLTSLAGEGYEQTPVRDLSGRIWFPTARGISVIDPARWRRLRSTYREPQVHLDAVRLDGRPVDRPGGSQSPIVVPPGVGRLQLECSVVELSAPERSIFRYRMADYDPEWITTQRPQDVVFRKIPPGNYELEAQAANQFLEWSEPRVLASFIVRPFWWQRGSVQGVAAVATLVAIAGIIRRKFRILEWERQRQESFSRQLIESQERERHRIARELHDGLGQNLSIARNTLHLAEQSVRSDPGGPNLLDDTSRVVEQAIAELRGIAGNLRPHLLERLGLSRTLEALATQIRASCACEVELITDPVDGMLPPEDEIHLYRVIQELLNNIVKHAEARKATVRLFLMSGRLYVEVDDDGKGYDPEKAAPSGDAGGGMGLAGIRERVKILGGGLEMRSSPGKGTEVNIIIPLK